MFEFSNEYWNSRNVLENSILTSLSKNLPRENDFINKKPVSLNKKVTFDKKIHL